MCLHSAACLKIKVYPMLRHVCRLCNAQARVNVGLSAALNQRHKQIHRCCVPKATLAATATSAEASRRLAAAVPEYEAAVAASPGMLQPAWLANPALAARVQFLSSMLAPCASQLAQVQLVCCHVSHDKHMQIVGFASCFAEACCGPRGEKH